MISFTEYYENGEKGMRFKALFEDSVLVAEKRYVNYQSHDSSYCGYNRKGNPTIEQLLNQTSGIKEVDGIAGIADLGRNDLLTQSQMMNFITRINLIRIFY